MKEHLKEAGLVKQGGKKLVNSAVTRQIVDHDHKIERVTVLKEVKHKKLDAYDSFFIGKKPHEHRLNTNMGNAHSYLHSLVSGIKM